MPHQCTNCGRQFADGSKEMLSGCPDCGGNKFQFQPKGRGSGTPSTASSATSDAADPASSTTSDTTDHPASSTTSDTTDDPSPGQSADPNADDPFSTPWPSSDGDGDGEGDDGDDGDIIEADPDPSVDAGGESRAQTDARRDFVSPDELADGAAEETAASSDPPTDPPTGPATDGTVASTPDEDRPDLAELRDELNEQFESIRVLNPGQYELNLMELYDREEYIISLREDGRYVIEVPETWRDVDPE